jgi:hypothetical protein
MHPASGLKPQNTERFFYPERRKNLGELFPEKVCKIDSGARHLLEDARVIELLKNYGVR